jgi:hypothetical protein
MLHQKRMSEAKQYTIRLNAEYDRPKWRQHKLGQDIDVAVLSCRAFPDDCVAYEVPRPNDVSDMAFTVGMDAFVVGFPKGISNNGVLPIWKRASIATEPGLPHDGKPVFLIDSATREGMSGAPVFLRTLGGYWATSGDQQLVVGASSKFIGIYSGRYVANDELEAQLGRVWQKSAIDEIIENGVVGSYELRN